MRCSETSANTNLRCVTSQNKENLILHSGESLKSQTLLLGFLTSIFPQKITHIFGERIVTKTKSFYLVIKKIECQKDTNISQTLGSSSFSCLSIPVIFISYFFSYVLSAGAKKNKLFFIQIPSISLLHANRKDKIDLNVYVQVLRTRNVPYYRTQLETNQCKYTLRDINFS